MVHWIVVRPWCATRPTGLVQCQRLGEMRHALAWIMSGVAFGTLGRIIERPIRQPEPAKREPIASSPVAAPAQSS